MPDPSPLDAVNILKEKSHSPKARMDALFHITENYDPAYLELFTNLLSDTSEHPDIRSAIALALGKVGSYASDSDVKALFLNTLLPFTKNNDVTVRNYTIQALGVLGHIDAAPELIKALSDKDNIVFHSAADALERLGKPVVPFLLDVLELGADDARCIAAWKLGELKYTDAVPQLTSTLKEDKNPELLALCAWALGEVGFGSPEVLEALETAKNHEHRDVRDRAVLGMKKIARHCN